MTFQINVSSFNAARLCKAGFHSMMMFKNWCQGIQGSPLIAESMSVTGFHSVSKPDIKPISGLFWQPCLVLFSSCPFPWTLLHYLECLPNHFEQYVADSLMLLITWLVPSVGCQPNSHHGPFLIALLSLFLNAFPFPQVIEMHFKKCPEAILMIDPLVLLSSLFIHIGKRTNVCASETWVHANIKVQMYSVREQ